MVNRNLKLVSTFQLIKRIALQADSGALHEFLSYRKVIYWNGKHYILPDFLWELRQNRFSSHIVLDRKDKNYEEKIDMIYDRTLKKFSLLKSENLEKNDGPFCNNHYKRINKTFSEIKSSQHITSSLVEEKEIGKLFQRYVQTQIHYSWLETLRYTNIHYVRYRWKAPTGEIFDLQRPKRISGHDLRNHLNNQFNIYGLKLERNEIQNFIYDYYGYGQNRNVQELADWSPEISENDDPIQKMELSNINENFYETIANEKAESGKSLRPAIRKLGPQGIRKLVLRILNEYIEDNYKDIEIAKEFELSKATFSRFAGRDWRKKEISNTTDIPDLWLNITRIISKDPLLLEFAIELGFKSIIEFISKKLDQ